MPVQNAVTKSLEFKPHKMRPRDSIAHVGHGTYTVSSSHAVHYTPKDGSTQRLGKFGSRGAAVSHAQEHHASAGAPTGKGFRLVSLDDYYDLTVKASPAAPPAAGGAAPAAPDLRVKKFPRRLKPTVRMKPISDAEAMTHLRSGTYNPAKQKSLRWLAALKALATGYGKTSGGGALKAANRGGSLPLLGPSGRAAGKSGGHYRKRGLSGKVDFGPDGRPGPRSDKAAFKVRSGRLRRAMVALPLPAGAAKPPKVYLPGVHNPKSPVRPAPGLKKPPSLGVKKTASAADARPPTSSKKSPAALGAGGATELSNSLENVVLKSGGSEMPNQNVNFNDLFKSELGSAGGDVLVDCPHCDVPITKGDLEKAHRGKGKTTRQSGPKHGKSSAHVRDHNPEGGTMRGGDGRGVHTPSRGVPGASKTDPAVGVQNSKGSHARKGGADSSVEEGEDDVDKSADAGEVTASARPRPTGVTDPVAVKKSITIRGTEWVQYFDDGSDAALAKSIAEGALGGTSPTQPLDLNHDLTRLLI